MSRFTPGILTERTGREDGSNEAPVGGVRDEESGKVYAFPLLFAGVAASMLQQAADAGTLAQAPILFPGGSDEDGHWMAEYEPFTFQALDEAR